MMYINNKQIIKNILCDTTYACAHWIQEIKTSIPVKDLIGSSIEEKWYNCLNHGGKLIIIDNEDYNKYEIDLKQLSKAVSTVRKYPKFKYETNWDGTFADCIMQIAVFNEIVFD